MLFKRRSTRERLARLYDERAVLRAQLDAAAEESAWLLLGDDPFEVAEGEGWRGHVAALRNALHDIEVRIFKLEIELDGDVNQRQ